MPPAGIVGLFPTSYERFSLAYAESVAAVDFFIRTYGKEKLVQLITSYHGGVTDDEGICYSSSWSDLVAAGEVLGGIGLEPLQRAELESQLLGEALRLLRSGEEPPAGVPSLVGSPLTERDVRQGSSPRTEHSPLFAKAKRTNRIHRPREYGACSELDMSVASRCRWCGAAVSDDGLWFLLEEHGEVVPGPPGVRLAAEPPGYPTAAVCEPGMRTRSILLLRVLNAAVIVLCDGVGSAVNSDIAAQVAVDAAGRELSAAMQRSIIDWARQ